MENRSVEKIWDAALGELQIQVSKPNYRTWLEKTTGLKYQDNQFVVSVPNTFVAEYLDKKQRSLIEKTLINLTSSPNVEVTFQVDGKYKNSPGTSGAEQKNPLATPAGASKLKSDYFFKKW